MASPTWWTWVWVNSRSWWWTGRPGVLRFMGSQRVRHDWATELNWIWLSAWVFAPMIQNSTCHEIKAGSNLWSIFQTKICWVSLKQLTWRSVVRDLMCYPKSVWPITTQKPIKRQGWWRGKFALFQRPANGRRADSCPKVNSPDTDNHWARPLKRSLKGI